MASFGCVSLILVFLLEMGSLRSDHTDSLHQVLSEFGLVRPVRTDSEGRFLSVSVSSHHLPRRKRHTHQPGGDPSLMGQGTASKEVELFYNVTVFGQNLHLHLHLSSRLVAPTATMDWEEGGHIRSGPIGDTSCFYTGQVSNMEDTSVAISNCDGLAGMIRTSQDKFFIEPLDRQWAGGEHEERQHIVYRSSAVIKKPQAVNHKEAINQTADDFLRGPLLGSLDLNQNMFESGSGSTRRRRYIEEAETFNIEVLLAVDYSVLLFHGRDHIQKYLLTLMNIVNEIYQDHSLGANVNIVLARIVMLSSTKSQELISVWNPQKSLENVCGWSYLQQREQSQAEQHDHTIYLTRQEFGANGMQGYAPVTGMCQLHRSCVLVFEDGFSSAFVAAHETGHVLGMEHDGEANNCEDDVLLGSIMSPRVQATFYRYHWSRCSWRELHQYLHTYDCLRDDPFQQNWPAQPPLPGFLYTMDQQCHFDFGSGYNLCTAYTTHEPCKQLWCSRYDNPYFCKTKKGPPLDGTKCGPGKHCFKGYCMRLTPDLLRQDGSWGPWTSYGSCSRTCGRGLRYRTRLCDNPAPANGGRTCFGNSFEFQLCNQEECPPLTDFREDQCKIWNPVFEHEGVKHHWLPYEHPEPDQRCRLYCQSKETRAVVSMNRVVHDGTLCSYSDSFSVCVRGECEHVGCDGQIASDKQEDRCGVCGGDNVNCKIIKGNFTRSAKKQGYLKILEIPKGARHLLIQEAKGTPHVLALKNQDTGHFFLNNGDNLPESQVLIEKGVAWDYSTTEEQEFIQTTGPLQYSVLLMVRPHGDSKITVSYKYTIQDRLRTSLESNMVQEEAIFYEWALKKWSHCSKPCGGGKQYTRFGCRRKADGKMVHRMFCSSIKKPRAIARNCNTGACSLPRWVTGGWGDCSATCGQTGWQRRWVSCQQGSSRGAQQRPVNIKLCGHERPEAKQACNRVPCPPAWRAGPWTPCSVSCGPGTQERQVACLGPGDSPGNCSEPGPRTTRACQSPPCSSDQKTIIQWLSRTNTNFSAPDTSSKQRCRGDRSVFCRMEALSRYCFIPGYWQMCCKSCSKENFSYSDKLSDFSSTFSPSRSSSSWNVSTESLASVATSTRSDSNHIIKEIVSSSLPSFTVPPSPSSGGTQGFVYVEYDDYEDYSSYEDLVISSENHHIVQTPSATVPLTATTTRRPREIAPPHLFKKKTATPTKTPSHTPSPVWAFAIPTDVKDIITTTEPVGQSSQTRVSLTEKPPPPTSSTSFIPLQKDNNSVDEVLYRIVGVDSDSMRGQQHFVPRMPPFRERTQNKRIQELLNEKRRQDVLRRSSRSRKSRTDSRQTG
ncbi:A disintegrin and metalloproteinase with thrombospondin motifs 2-like isoform X2 [Betta splendens]|uniref:A disintegrin and metalloproteinase with thrombospondin motifs 2-like isoform X2 n=1 Tax=Betta splendens TaxID=158456 RepID=A0A6P7P9B9_BETSP|nr:A disintegrin and metalloproteinase with thrombospondin motifs 2-like isoform X2 [Betta splendens]